MSEVKSTRTSHIKGGMLHEDERSHNIHWVFVDEKLITFGEIVYC